MDLNDISSRVDANRSANAQVNRQAATANPEFDAGMGDDPFDSLDDFGGGSLFGDDSSGGFGGDSGFGEGGFGGDSGFGGGGFGGSTGGFGSGGFGGGGFGMDAFSGASAQQPQQEQKSMEDKALETMGQAAKSSMNFFKALVDAFRASDSSLRATWGRYSITMSIVVAVMGILIMIFFNFSVGAELLIGSLLSAATGVLLLCFNQSAVNSSSDEVQFENPQPDMSENNFVSEFSWDDTADSFADSDFGDSDDEFGDEDFEIDIDDEEEPDIDFDKVNFDMSPSTSSGFGANADGGNLEAAQESISSLPSAGIVDRRTLFERQMIALAGITPAYASQTQITEGSDLFNTLDAVVQDSAEVFKSGNTNEVPYLVSAVDTLFYIRLEIQRVKYIKNVDAYTQEIVNIFQYDKSTGKRDTSVYGLGEFVGNRIYVKLMKGETAFVSLRDIYKNEESVITDLGMKMPVVMGLDIEGTPVIQDFYDINSILITGMARSGKSWFMLAVLYQMMVYSSPEDVEFYIFDPKEKMSDFTSAITPHVKNFVSADAEILAQLKHVVRVLGPERKKKIGEANCVNINDYNRIHPSDKIPHLYVIIDEVVTLSQRMSPEDNKEFQALLLELISQLPGAGVRAFLVPHLVKDQFIKKSTTSLIPCRVSVRGNQEHIADSCGVKNFQHPLTHMGDMCVVLQGNPEPQFIHAVALAKTNEEIRELFRFVGDLWAKICPQSVPGSVYERIRNGGSLTLSTSAGTVDDQMANMVNTASNAKVGAAKGAKSMSRGTSSSASVDNDTAPSFVNTQSVGISDDLYSGVGNSISMDGEEFDIWDDQI